jgi:hypothetical protein
MKLDKEFFTNLDKLEKYKTHPDLKVFFDTIDKLEKLPENINDEIYKSPSDKSEIGKQAKDLTKKLEVKKNEIAMRTKTQKEFDAVYECIDYLERHFN